MCNNPFDAVSLKKCNDTEFVKYDNLFLKKCKKCRDFFSRIRSIKKSKV